MTSEEFATKLLNSQKVAVVPGTAFGDCGEDIFVFLMHILWKI